VHDQPPTSQERRHPARIPWSWAVCLVCIAALRVHVIRVVHPAPESDFAAYDWMATRIVHQGVRAFYADPSNLWASSNWGPGYPLFLAGLYRAFGHSLFAARVANVILVVLTGLLVMMLAERLRRGMGLWAGIGFGVLPSTAIYAATTSSESLGLLLLTAAIAAIACERWLLGGFVFGLAALTRSADVLLIPGLLAAWCLARGQIRPRFAPAFAVLAFAVVIAPWSVNRSLMQHRPVLITSNQGSLFYMGNHPKNMLGGTYEIPRQYEPTTLHERELLRAGLRNVLAHPGHYAWLCGRRLLIWFGLDRDHWMMAYWLRMARLDQLARALVMLLAIIGAIATRAAPAGRMLALPAASYVILTSLTHFAPRYHTLALGLLVPLAAAGLGALASRLTHGAGTPRPAPVEGRT